MMTATMVRLQKTGNLTVTRVIDKFDLVAYQQKDINLLSITANNQSGAGAPTPAQVGWTIRFTCNYSDSR